MEIKQAVFGELDARHARPRDPRLQHVVAVDHARWASRRRRPDKVVGFHFFYPASMMRLIEVIEGDDTSPETMQAASNFAQAIRKMPIRCAEAPGFVVNRILNSAIVGDLARPGGERRSTSRRSTRRSPTPRRCRWARSSSPTSSGLDTVLHVAEHLQESYGDRFYVHKGMEELVEAGNLGAKTGKGFYEHGS